jgi:hypothetical protein
MDDPVEEVKAAEEADAHFDAAVEQLDKGNQPASETVVPPAAEPTVAPGAPVEPTPAVEPPPAVAPAAPAAVEPPPEPVDPIEESFASLKDREYGDGDEKQTFAEFQKTYGSLTRINADLSLQIVQKAAPRLAVEAIEQGTGASLDTLRRMVRGFQRDEIVSGIEKQGIADARSYIGNQEFIAFCDKNPVLAEMVDSDDPAKIALAINEYQRAGGARRAPVDGARAALKADLHGSSMRNRRDPPSGEPTAGDLDREFEEASAAEAKRFGGG